MYLTLEEYINMGGRRVTKSAEFERYEEKARSVLDLYTQNRIKEPTAKIRRLMVELIDLVVKDEERDIVSTSNDGVVVKYSDRNENHYKEEMRFLITAYCGDLAWRGVTA